MPLATAYYGCPKKSVQQHQTGHSIHAYIYDIDANIFLKWNINILYKDLFFLIIY